MRKSVILCLEQGDLNSGCSYVSLELLDIDNRSLWKYSCRLPPDIELLELYRRWQLCYRDYYELRGWCSRGIIEEQDDDPIAMNEAGITNFSDFSEGELLDLSKKAIARFNQWLNFDAFAELEKQLRSLLNLSEKICVVVETDDEQLRQLPWERWQFVEDYHNAGLARSNFSRNRVETLPIQEPRQGVSILCIIGNSEKLDTEADRKEIKRISGAIPIFLDQPPSIVLQEQLWEKGCDILFFAGHSSSIGEGCIKLNQEESLTIENLRNALTKAIQRGLKLAIFNSCDGLKLASDLADLSLAAVIVMQQPVPDEVAQKFLRYFLQAFSGGASLDDSVREARIRLQGIEKDFPCASLLPTLVWNRAQALPRWQDWCKKTKIFPLRAGWRNFQMVLFASMVATSAVMGLRWLSSLEFLEMPAYDYLMSHRPKESVDPRLLLIEVTDKDTHYQYPVDDATLARALKIIEQGKPRAVGLDMHRYQARNRGRKQLIDRFRQNPDIYTVCAFGYDGKNVISPPAELSKPPLNEQLGFSDLELDKQLDNSIGIVRRQLLSYDAKSASTSPCTTPYSLSFMLAYRFLDAEGKPLTVTDNTNGEWQSDKVVFKPLAARTGSYQRLNGRSTQILLNYRSNPEPAVKFNLQEVLEGRVPGNVIKDKIVLMGYTTSIANDGFHTPYGNIAGVWIHAHMVSNIISAVIDKRQQIWVLPQWGDLQWGDALWVWSWSFIVGLLVWRFRTVAHLILICAVTIWILQQVCLVIITYGGWMPFIPSALSLMVTGCLVVYTCDIKDKSYLNYSKCPSYN